MRKSRKSRKQVIAEKPISEAAYQAAVDLATKVLLNK